MAFPEGALADLNDLRFFAAVVEHGGFSAASRALGVPKSRLSKRVALLEERLGVRLLQRTTRRFAVTEVGERFLAHCRAMLEEAQAAQDVVDRTARRAARHRARQLPDRARADGRSRTCCRISSRSIRKCRCVWSRRIAASTSSTKASTSRSACAPSSIRTPRSCRAASASRACCSRRIRSSSTSTAGRRRRRIWRSCRCSRSSSTTARRCSSCSMRPARRSTVEMRARLISGEFSVLYEAAKRGMGVTALPEFVCAPAISRGELEVVLPEWSIPQGVAHFVYPSRRGLLPRCARSSIFSPSDCRTRCG